MEDTPLILIVEDDRQVAGLLETALGRAGFRTKAVPDGKAMDKVLDTENPDLMLLDVMLPGEDGLPIARRMFAKRRCPIIMLTAIGEGTDRVVGLDLGADDSSPSRSAHENSSPAFAPCCAVPIAVR